MLRNILLWNDSYVVKKLKVSLEILITKKE